MVVKLLTIPIIYKAKFKFEVNLAPITIAKTALCNSERIDLFSFLVIVTASLNILNFWLSVFCVGLFFLLICNLYLINILNW